MSEKLNVEWITQAGELTAELSGTVDHHTLLAVREQIDREIYRSRTKRLVLDLTRVEFMDSSGLGLILGRYTKMSDLGGQLILRGVDSDIMRIVRLAGIDKFIPIEKAKKA